VSDFPDLKLTGYQRRDGRWGFRNQILIFPMHSALCSIARNVADSFSDASVVTISHDWSGEVDKDWKRISKALTGFAANPNSYAVIFLTLGNDVEKGLIKDALAIGVENHVVHSLKSLGSMQKLIEQAKVSTAEYLEDSKKVARVAAPWSAIHLGLECGGSDALSGITANPALGVASDYLVELGAVSVLGETTEILGAEHLLAARAITPEVGKAIVEMVARYERSVNYEGIDMRGAQPSRGNIEGGLTTLEEKSLGAAKKAGNAPFTGALDYADPAEKPGLYMMDTPGHDIEQLTGFAAAGINICVFTSGRGTPTGSAVVPTIKVSTNTPMFQAIPDLIDLNAGTIADGTELLKQVGVRIFKEIVDVANGKLTKAEIGGHQEFALSRMYKTEVI
jgi:altronate dehydratase large subunit